MLLLTVLVYGCLHESKLSDDAGTSCTSSAECSGATPICDTNVGQCVGCLAHTDCPDPAASSCNLNNVCVGCADSDQCSHLTATPVCDTAQSTCVQCLADSDCDPNACTPDNTCGSTEAGTVGGCQPCQADGECGPGPVAGTYRCVELSYTPSPGYRSQVCVVDLASHRQAIGDSGALCPNTTPSAQTLTSLNGTQALYCVPRSAVATCEAILAFANPCPNGPADCNAPGALCRDLGAAGQRCTYECTGGATSPDCPTGSSCDPVNPPTCDPN